jgi:hypothetical protein
MSWWLCAGRRFEVERFRELLDNGGDAVRVVKLADTDIPIEQSKQWMSDEVILRWLCRLECALRACHDRAPQNLSVPTRPLAALHPAAVALRTERCLQSGHTGRKRGRAAPWPVSWNTTVTSWPTWTSSGLTSTMLVTILGPSVSST